jgi:nucleotide-binding universal stress UspA family protein
MELKSATTRIALRRILFLTDFSRPSEGALPFVMSIARNYGSVVNALHVLTPPRTEYATPELGDAAVAVNEDLSQAEMEKLDSQLVGIPHETNVEWGAAIWPVVEREIKSNQIDLIVVGTRGRTGAQKVLLGSVAEEVFRRSSVPVLTIGPAVTGGAHNNGRFRNVLLATDFGKESEAAAHYAISFAQENQARLTLLHVIRGPRGLAKDLQPSSVAEVMHHLSELVPPEAELWCRPEPVVEYGEPGKAILRAAKSRGADLIVLGLHSTVPPVGTATRILRATAHKVVAHAPCPVLTARA